MRIIFMGTPDFAVPVLQGLIDNSDAELISIADVIRSGEITKEGLEPLE